MGADQFDMFTTERPVTPQLRQPALGSLTFTTHHPVETPVTGQFDIHGVVVDADEFTAPLDNAYLDYNSQAHVNETTKQSSEVAREPSLPLEREQNASSKSAGGKARHHCQEDGCLESFTRQSDLNRHMRTKHGRKSIFCPHNGCRHASARTGGFARRDHLVQHLRKMHSGQELPVGVSDVDGARVGRKTPSGDRVECHSASPISAEDSSRERANTSADTSNASREVLLAQIEQLREQLKDKNESMNGQDEEIARLKAIIDEFLGRRGRAQ